MNGKHLQAVTLEVITKISQACPGFHWWNIIGSSLHYLEGNTHCWEIFFFNPPPSPHSYRFLGLWSCITPRMASLDMSDWPWLRSLTFFIAPSLEPVMENTCWPDLASRSCLAFCLPASMVKLPFQAFGFDISGEGRKRQPRGNPQTRCMRFLLLPEIYFTERALGLKGQCLIDLAIWCSA